MRKTLHFKIATLVLLLSVLSACALQPLSKIDLSDIASMNIGEKMPDLLYADESSAVLEGTFGVIVFDFLQNSITDRIPVAAIREKTAPIEIANAAVSSDARTLYFAGADEQFQFRESTYCYSIPEKQWQKRDSRESPPTLFTPESLAPGDADFRSYCDESYLIGETAVMLEGCFIHLRANQDWSMKSLQIVKVDTKSKQSTVINVFPK